MVDSRISEGEALGQPARRQSTWAPSIWTARLASVEGNLRCGQRGHGVVLSMSAPHEPFKVWTNAKGEEGYLHGTRADLKPGDLIEAGRSSNYGKGDSAVFVYMTATLDAATWGAERSLS